MTVEQWTDFHQYHARNRERATRLRGFVVFCAGVGGVGSFSAAYLAHAGCSLVLADRDRLDLVNQTRHYVTDRAAVGQPKALALARKLRSEVPTLQSIRGIDGDIEKLSDSELRALLSGTSLVLGSSGRDAVDHPLNLAARDLGLPLVVPSLLAGTLPVLGDIHVIGWHIGRARRGACFECLRQRTTQASPPAEAQPGTGAEVVRVASVTAEVILGLLLSDSPQHQVLNRQLSRGVCYFVIPRWPPALRSVLTRPRPGCPACSPRSTATPTRTDAADMRVIRDMSVGLVLASTILWHQVVPGFDAVAAIGLVAAGGLWWRGRLPSFQQTAAWIRRNFWQ